jgi:DinB superfamily
MEETNMITLATTDLTQAQQYFSHTRGRVAAAAAGLSNAQWQFKPAPDRWSIAENLEHMVLVHDHILGPICQQLAQAPAPPADRDWRMVDAIVLEKFPDRSTKAMAPEFVWPTGTWALPAALDRLFGSYERLHAYVESTPDLREHIADAPPLKFVTKGAFETMDGYQWALAIAAHDERHVRQILEIKADPNYPA